MACCGKPIRLAIGIHVSAQIRIGEGDVAEGEGRVASQLAVDLILASVIE